MLNSSRFYPVWLYMISIATKSTLTIKNVAHLTTGIKFNVSFMRNNSFYEKFLNFNHFSSQICTFSILATVFAQITNLKMQTFFIFHALYGLKVSIILSKFSESYLGKMFFCFSENVTLFLELLTPPSPHPLLKCANCPSPHF